MLERARSNLPCFCTEDRVKLVMGANVNVFVKVLLLKMEHALKNQAQVMTCSDTKQVSIVHEFLTTLIDEKLA